MKHARKDYDRIQDPENKIDGSRIMDVVKAAREYRMACKDNNHEAMSATMDRLCCALDRLDGAEGRGMNNPTGAENAQVELLEDSKEFDLKARKIMIEHLSSLQEAQKIVEGFVYGRLGDRYLAEDMAASTIATALREAEQRGMRRAQDRLIDGLAAVYREDCILVARLCDEHLDRSGALLGKVRNKAIERAAAAPTTQK